MDDQMIRCNVCMNAYDKRSSACPYCGAPNPAFYTPVPDTAETSGYDPGEPFYGQEVVGEPYKPAEPLENQHENVVAGIGGALLFSMGGVATYVILYQFNLIASISAFVTFSLASIGYGIFSGNRKSTSLASVLVPIIITVLMIFVAEYIAICVALFIQFKQEGYKVSLTEVFRYVPVLFKDREFVGFIVKDLLLALLFGALGTVGSIIRAVKMRNAARQAR